MSGHPFTRRLDTPVVMSDASPHASLRPQWPMFLRRAMVMGHHHWRFAGMLAMRLLGQPIMTQPMPSRAALAQGLTIILPGIEAAGPYVQDMRDGLVDGHVPGAIQIFYWGIAFPEGYFPNLLHLRRNRAKGAELARMIMRHQDEFPGSPIHLVANSGGVGPALFALETLPRDRAIDGLVVLAGAASNSYDLRPILHRTRKGILNSYSTRDYFILNLGTRIFGTADRKFSVSCGHSGFKIPATQNGDTELYGKLQQIGWSHAFGRECDWWGNHGTSTSREFMRCHIAPWVNAPIT